MTSKTQTHSIQSATLRANNPQPISLSHPDDNQELGPAHDLPLIELKGGYMT